jgi:DNA-binding response OmpR family regulator
MTGSAAGGLGAVERDAEGNGGMIAEPWTLKTVLLVESDPDVADALLEGLTDAGYGVVGPYRTAAAAEAGAALHLLDAAVIDVDHVAPSEGGGAALAERLAQRWGLRVILLTHDPDRARALAARAAGILVKPFSMLQLLDAVCRLPAPGTKG